MGMYELDDVPVVMAALRPLCAKLPAAEEYVMVHHPAFRVGKKPFVIAGMRTDDRAETLTVNLGRDMQEQLLEDARFTRTPYIGQHGWVTIAHDDVRKGELAALVIGSYRRIANTKQLALLEGASAAKSQPASTAKTSAAKKSLGSPRKKPAAAKAEKPAAAKAKKPVAAKRR